jgi:hypothetical protein
MISSRSLAFIICCLIGLPNLFAATTESAPMNGAPELEPTEAAETTSQLVDDETLQRRFDQGFQSYQSGKYERAMQQLFSFVSDASEETLNVEWGEFFLALSYEELGLQHAAIDTYAHLLGRKPNPQIVSAVLRTFETLSFTDSYDQELMLDYGVVNQDFGFVDESLQDFINYQQGLYNWRVGLVSWGDENFSKVKPDSHYFHRINLAKAHRFVYHGDMANALSFVNQILEQTGLPDDLTADAELLAARLHFEQRAFDQAIPLYANAVSRGNGTSPILLELAWSHYLMGDREKALGLLYAFDAPSYRSLFAPEYFVLKAHIYKDVCYYQAAERVSSEFSDRYQSAMDALYDRKKRLNPDYSELHQPLLSRQGVNLNWNLLKRLQSERPLINEKDWASPLVEHLKGLYRLKIESASWKLQQSIKAHFDQLANQTLVISEEMSLIEYEMGVQRFQNTLDSVALHEEAERLARQRDGSVAYKFQNEYWNDELGHLVIELESNCHADAVWEADK